MLNIIGEIAGEIWGYLNSSENTPVSLTNLAKKTGRRKDEIVLGTGWLAREGKIIIEEKKSTVKVSLVK